MSSCQSLNIFKLLQITIKQYENVCKLYSAEEFIKNKLNICTNDNIKEEMIKHFIKFTKYRKIVEEISDNFVIQQKLKRYNKLNLRISVYLIVFELNDENFDFCVTIFKHLTSFYLNDLLTHFQNEDTIVFITQTSCQIFDKTFILDKIIYPLVEKRECIVKLQENLFKTVDTKPLTVPEDSNVLRKFFYKYPQPPPNTPREIPQFKARPFSKSNDYDIIQRKLKRVKETNSQKAEKLLKQVAEINPRTVQRKIPKISRSNDGLNRFKAKKVPLTIPVNIKQNLAVTLRQASTYIKQQNKEIKQIEELLKGGFDLEKLELLKQQERAEENKKQVEEIERKHLAGLLSYEDAILAKKNFEKELHLKAAAVKEEKQQLLNQYYDWKDNEEAKLQDLVKKIQKTNENVKESERELLENKQMNVRMMQYEINQLLRKAQERENEEMKRKMELIQQIRTLHKINMNLHVKEFDPTECPNFGLLCEMSIAELQIRLAIIKEQIQLQVEKKRQTIAKNKEERQKFVENAREFIEQMKNNFKPQKTVLSEIRREENKEIVLMREELERKRAARMNLS